MLSRPARCKSPGRSNTAPCWRLGPRPPAGGPGHRPSAAALGGAQSPSHDRTGPSGKCRFCRSRRFDRTQRECRSSLHPLPRRSRAPGFPFAAITGRRDTSARFCTSASSAAGGTRPATRAASARSRRGSRPRVRPTRGRARPAAPRDPCHAAAGSVPAATGMPSYSTTCSGLPAKRKLLFMWSRSSSPTRRNTSAHERNDP